MSLPSKPRLILGLMTYGRIIQRCAKDLETFLGELGADIVDISYLHAADRSVPFGEALQEVDKLHKEGKFKRLSHEKLFRGLLTGKHRPTDNRDEGRYDTKGFLGPIYRSMCFKDGNFQAIEMIQTVAGKRGLTLIETTFRWCVHQSDVNMANKGGNDAVVIGVSGIGQPEQNLKDSEGPSAYRRCGGFGSGMDCGPRHKPSMLVHASGVLI
ncbi:hypothetical protein FQN52_000359 [Onygenales sp. PD_12]|nr:hypothetical protein FQN52_000359 [Onygenales sp. PD_12]